MYDFELMRGTAFHGVWDVISYGMKIAEITTAGRAVSIEEKEYGVADADELLEIEEAFYYHLRRM